MATTAQQLSWARRSSQGKLAVDPTGPVSALPSSHYRFNGGSGAAFVVDFSPVIRDIKQWLDGASDKVARIALYNTLNRACAPLLTETRRIVSKQTSAPYGRVMSHIRADKAHPGRLSYKLLAKDTAMKLSDFRPPKPGTKNPRLKVWGRTVKYDNAFVIRFRSGNVEVVKRLHPHNSEGHAVKTLYGPIIPREMLKDESLQNIASVIPKRVLARLPHELERAFAKHG